MATDEDKLYLIFLESLGLGASKTQKARYRKMSNDEKIEFANRKFRRLPKDEQKAILSRGGAKTKLHNRLVEMNKSRANKLQGGVPVNKMVFVRKSTPSQLGFNDFHDRFFSEQKDFAASKSQTQIGDNFRRETWRDGLTYAVVRSPRGWILKRRRVS